MTDNITIDKIPVEDSTSQPDGPASGFTVVFTPESESAQRRRRRYTPRADTEGWWRINEEWTGCTWRIVGREPVSDIVLRWEPIDT